MVSTLYWNEAAEPGTQVKTVNPAELVETNQLGASLYQHAETGTWYVQCACAEVSPDVALRSDARQWWAHHWQSQPFCTVLDN